jgi:hypothetical protein
MSTYYKTEKQLSRDLVLELLTYCPNSGVFVWNNRMGANVNKGDIAGGVNSLGYRRIRLNGKYYSAHRLAFLIAEGSFPNGHVDHINQNRSDNRLENLRVVSVSGNGKNRSLGSNNTSGIIGVTFDKKVSKWKARVTHEKKRILIGYYDKLDEAKEAILLARDMYGYHENHGKPKQWSAAQ